MTDAYKWENKNREITTVINGLPVVVEIWAIFHEFDAHIMVTETQTGEEYYEESGTHSIYSKDCPWFSDDTSDWVENFQMTDEIAFAHYEDDILELVAQLKQTIKEEA